MKYIKNYQNEQTFEANGNTLGGYEYMLHYMFPYYGGVMCEEYTPYMEQPAKNMETKDRAIISEEYGPFRFYGSVDEVVPGAAYCKAETSSFYNGTNVPKVTCLQEGTYQWEDLGITDEVFEEYLELFKDMNRTFKEYKVTLPGDIRSAYLYPMNGETQYIEFYTSTHCFKVNATDRTASLSMLTT